jgi:hypothetical protein
MGFIAKRTWSDISGPVLRIAFALVLILILLYLGKVPQ